MNTRATVIEEGNLVSYKMKLLTLTPVFIGGGEDSHLGRNQYILENVRNVSLIYILDENKWTDFLCGKNRLKKDMFHDFLKFLTNQAENVNSHKKSKINNEIYQWLKSQNFQYNDYRECIKYIIKAPDGFKKHDIHCFVKNLDSKPYIPGSSIKGAIRTAVFFNLIEQKEIGFKAKFLKKIRSAITMSKDDFIKETENIFFELNGEVFWNLPLEKYENKPNIHCDVLRGIQISDSSTMDPRKLELMKKRDMLMFKNKRTNSYINESIPLYREYLVPETECVFTLTLDQMLLKNSPLRNIHIINEMLGRFKDYLIGDNSKILSSFKKNLKDIPQFHTMIPKRKTENIESSLPNICIGGGTGFLTKTVIHAIAHSKEEADDIIRQILDKFFKEHKHCIKDKEISPRTLKLAKSNNINLITGWCNIQQSK